MGDYDHIGNATVGLYKVAVVGAIATLILSGVIIVGAIAGIWWLCRHVAIQ